MHPRGSLAGRLAGWTVATCAALLAACGGGPADDGADTANRLPADAAMERHPGRAALVLQPPVAIGGPGHRVRLTWRGAPPAARVSAWLGDDMQDFHVIATGLRDGAVDVNLGPSWTMDWPSARLRLRACHPKGHCVDSNVQPLTDVLLAGLDKIDPLQKDGRLSNFASHIALSGDGRTLAVTDPSDRPPCTTPSLAGRQDMLAVGTPEDPGDAGDPGTGPGNRNAPRTGAVYIFKATEDGWRRQAFLKPRNAHPADNFGTQVALSGDGRVLLAKACGRSANEPGVRRNHPAGTSVLPPEPPVGFPSCRWGGSAYVLTRDDAGRWTHAAAAVPIDAGNVSYEFFPVALSADASTFALGTALFLPAAMVERRMYVY